MALNVQDKYVNNNYTHNIIICMHNYLTPFFIKHKTAEIAIIMAITLNINTPSTLPTISPPLVPDVVEISVYK